ncbi:LOW QUALITY PROTEIN: hypothetical protein Cgig2_027945 [Carnegiea gigantea]|uniref:Uncharacterized protein n=1 Tax=Carnegiea gigantea TaxID=171969 RepID=A0A9Q1GT22_9CARY|nr:LOW QUALITY PROTEIN: hypothetical protein Cgig2_027945 [Carnegiea gigantea]
MSVITEAIKWQVSEEVKRAMEAANSARPLPHFGYVPTAGCEPSHRQVRIPSSHSAEREREASRSNQGGRPYSGHYDRHMATAIRPSGCLIQGQTTKSTTASTPYATHSRQTAWVEEQEQTSKPRGEVLVSFAENRSLHSLSRRMKSVRRKALPLLLQAMQKEVNSTGMVRLHICFGGKLKAKNLEVDFLIVDVPTAYNVILGRPTLHKKHSNSIQGVSCLISYTITFTERRNKLHLLPVLALICGPLVLVDVVELFPALLIPGRQPLQHSPAALTPRATASAIVTSSSIILGGSEVPEVAKSHDLAKVSLGQVDGRPPGAQGRAADGLRSSPQGLRRDDLLLGTMVRSPADQLPEYRGIDWSAPVGADAAVSSGRPSVHLRIGKLIVGFFPRERAPAAKITHQFTPNGHNQGADKVLEYTFLACWFTRHCLSSFRWRSASAATCSGLTSPVSKTINSSLLALHKTKGKSGQNQTEKLTNTAAANTLRKILKDQKARYGKEEPIQRFPVTRLALPPPRALHRFYCLSHKFGDGSRPLMLPYIELEVAGHLSLFSRGLPEGLTLALVRNISPTDSRRMKRKSYFQCFTFNFFSMAVTKPGLLLKQYHPKSPVSLGALWTVSTRLNAHTIQGGSFTVTSALGIMKLHPTSRRYCFSRVIIFNSEWVGAPRNSSPSATISGTSPTREQPFLLSTNFPRVEDTLWEEELIEAPSEDECLHDLSEEEGDVPLDIELILVEATSTLGLDELGAEQGLPCVPSANNSSGDLMRGVDLRHRIGNPFGFPIFILSGDARNHPAINKGREARDCGWQPFTWGPTNPLRSSPLDEQDEDIIIQVQQTMFEKGMSEDVPAGDKDAREEVEMLQ